jgi:hypothetical protein
MPKISTIEQPQMPGHFESNGFRNIPGMINVNDVLYPQHNEIFFEDQQEIQQRNAQIIREAEREFARQYQRQQYEREHLARNLLMKGFPSLSNIDSLGTSHFYNAFAEIDSMLNGTKALSIARSVFLVENAFYENTLNYSDYKDFIKRKAEFCNRIMKDSKQNPSDNLAKNMAIFRLLTDTVPFKNGRREKTEYHLPLQYDYYDYKSEENFDSHFVTKLMCSGTGQCYSMPLYYLILAEEMNTEAYWSMSPRHSFVKIKDKKGNWYNIELTCSSILSDAHYTNNSYIKAEALQNKIYLEPLDKKQIVADQLLSLARTYLVKYGLDDFYLQCINSVPQYIPNSIEALRMQVIYYNNVLINSANLLNIPDLQSFGYLQPFADKTFEQLETYHKEIDDLGYEDTPKEIYENLLKYIEKQKLASEKNKTILLNEIK